MVKKLIEDIFSLYNNKEEPIFEFDSMHNRVNPSYQLLLIRVFSNFLNEKIQSYNVNK